MKRFSTLGDVLVQAGLVDPQGIARALEVQARDGGSLARIVADLGLATEDSACSAVAAALGLVYVQLQDVEVPKDLAVRLSPEFCRERKVLPLTVEGRRLGLAMADPFDQATIQDAEFRTSSWVVPLIATETAILEALERLYPEAGSASLSFDLIRSVDPAGEIEAGTEDADETVDHARLARDVTLPPIVRLVNVILTDATLAGASDIHIEPQEEGLQVRHRVDGILHDVLTIPKHLRQPTISRLKIISGMDIAEHRKPQDGRSRLSIDQRKIDLRVSTLPTSFGEKVVVRLLESANARIEMDQLGFAPALLSKFQELLSRPQGMILVTGPTGSGKTSTLYAALNWVKSRSKNVITVEDPIEYQLPGVNQVQINSRAGMTFAAGLRSILRQDPNIVLVGEIRDKETADIALQAAQTGHLLLSTLHTNDAPSSITRLIDLGIEPFLVASSIIGILAQRLVRRPCAACTALRPPPVDVWERVAAAGQLSADARWQAGTGCEQCRQSGYRGRLAIHELFVITDDLREQVSRLAPEHQIRDAARRAGMHSLMEDGIEKAARGLTTLEEVLRVAPPDEARKCVRSEPSAVEEPNRSPLLSSSGGAKERVLIVEDSATVSTVVKYFLELEGFEVLVAEDGLAGLDLARREAPAVVVTDLNMPGMDGISLVGALREDPRTRDMAILMLTSETSVESEARGLAIGADDYLAKPVEPRRLAARVKAVLARVRGRQAVSP